MKRKYMLLVSSIIIAMILNDIFMAMELVWFIQLSPFIFILLIYLLMSLKIKR
ncbi:hypothetical protein [Clostridium sp. UBA1652]|uniref:hypothetical protein n=1 Tax=Clostridium sp. UBA1652 TaxID=1946348 RepID=UPI002579718B|nr:hypothetical protein [Clostridium sp. UBA1652]